MNDSINENAVALMTTREYLTFTLATEEYAVDILKVQEIRGYDAVTPLPELPAMIKGVINLRGLIVPVVDLRIKFRIGVPRYDETTAMMILNINGRTMALVVDSVSAVVALQPDQIHPAPPFGSALDTRFLAGLGTVDDRMLIVLDVEKLLSHDELLQAKTALPLAA